MHSVSLRPCNILSDGESWMEHTSGLSPLHNALKAQQNLNSTWQPGWTIATSNQMNFLVAAPLIRKCNAMDPLSDDSIHSSATNSATSMHAHMRLQYDDGSFRGGL